MNTKIYNQIYFIYKSFKLIVFTNIFILTFIIKIKKILEKLKNKKEIQ